MRHISNIINFVLLVIGAILASNTDGSLKTVGIVFLAFSVFKLPSFITYKRVSK